MMIRRARGDGARFADIPRFSNITHGLCLRRSVIWPLACRLGRTDGVVDHFGAIFGAHWAHGRF